MQTAVMASFRLRLLFFLYIIDIIVYNQNFAVGAHLNSTVEHRLVENLLKNYPGSNFLPVKNAKDNVTIQMGLSLLAIEGVDLVNGKLTIDVWLHETWKDQHLTWDPKDYGDIAKVHIQADKIWRPNIVVYNSAEPNSDIFSPRNDDLIVLTSDGGIINVKSQQLTTRCLFDLSKEAKYADRQCNIVFGTWVHDGTKVDLKPVSQDVETSSYHHNKFWFIKSFKAKRNLVQYSCCPEPYIDITYTLTFNLKQDQVLGKVVSTERRLYHHLLDDYVPGVLPVPVDNGSSKPIVLNCSVIIFNVDSVNLHDHTLTTKLLLSQEWNDPQLKWKPEQFNGLKSTQVPIDKIWQPDTVLINSESEVVNYVNPQQAAVHSNGDVKWSMLLRTVVTCGFDLTHFPFDMQSCMLKFDSWIYTTKQLTMTSKKFMVENFYNELHEWTVVDAKTLQTPFWSSGDNISYPHIEVEFTMERKSSYFIHLFTAPAIILVLLVPIMFMLPTDCPEKISLGMGILVSLTVLLLMLEQAIPTRGTVPQIGVYYIAAFTLVGLSVVVTTLVLNLWNRGRLRYHAPRWLKKIFIDGIGRVLCVYKSAPSQGREPIIFRELQNQGEMGDAEGSIGTERTASSDLEAMSEWHTIARVIDRLFLVVFTVCAVVTTAVIAL